MTSNGLGNIGNNLSNLNLEDKTKKIVDSATTPVKPDKKTETKGAANLESNEFLDRALDVGGISSYNPSKGGLKLNVGSAITNIPLYDITQGNTNSLIKDYNSNAGANVNVRLERERFSVGVKANLTGSLQTEGVKKNYDDFSQIYQEGQNLEKQISEIQSELNSSVTQLQNSPTFARAEQLISEISSNPLGNNSEKMTELQNILNSGEMQGLLNNLNSSLGKMNSSMTSASNMLGILGDGSRQILGDAAVRGAAELDLGYRTKRYDLGNGWGVRGGIEAAVILPLPNPVNTPSTNGLPEFKTMMSKVSTEVNVTTSGISQLQNRINSLKDNLNSIQNATGSTKESIDKAKDIANQIDPNNPYSALPHYGEIMNIVGELENNSNTLNETAKSLENNIQGLSNDLDNVKVQTSVGVTTVTANKTPGVGIKDVGVTFDGPLGDKTNLSLSTGFMNPYGVLMGEKNHYHLEKGSNESYNLVLDETNKTNVFHEFYDPTVYAGAGLNFNEGTWYKTQVTSRFEKSLTSDVMRASGIVTQNLGPVSLRTGIVNTDLKNGVDSNMYMGGIGFGSIKNPNIFTVDAATNSFDPKNASNVAVRAGLNIPF